MQYLIFHTHIELDNFLPKLFDLRNRHSLGGMCSIEFVKALDTLVLSNDKSEIPRFCHHRVKS
jgi:hypothetical protein